MELGEIVDKIFSIDGNIRYVGIVGPEPKYEVLESRMKEGVKSLTPDKTDREFVEVIPQVILGASEKLEESLGSVIYSLIRYQNVTLAFFKMQEHTVILSIEPGIFIMPIYERIRTLLGIGR